MKKPKKPKKMLGYGDHWEAVGLKGEAVMEILRKGIPFSVPVGTFAPPFPGSPCDELTQLEWPQASLLFTTLVGRPDAEEALVMLSAFPVVTRREEWTVRIDGVLDSYGAVEGVVEGVVASGHPLQWFAPRFGFEVEAWRQGGLARVGFAALALQVSRYPAEPIMVREGPLVEEQREALRAEGKHKEAEAGDLTVTVCTDELRTLYSLNHDHCAFIGRVMRVTMIRPRPEFRGWHVDLECLPDRSKTGWRLPLFIFPPALEEGYTPTRGDLIEGTAWLQGSWKGVASDEEIALWRQEAKEENAGDH